MFSFYILWHKKEKMKNRILVFLLMNICFYAAAQTDVSTAKWIHVTVDGDATDWGSLNFYDDQTQLNFGLANDSENIYLCFTANTQPVQMKLMRAGMKVELSAKGKTKHEAFIVFPLPQSAQAQGKDSSFNKTDSPGTQPVFNKETFRANYIAHHTMMQVSGFADSNGEISTKNPAIPLAINWDSSSNLVYEIGIAKKEFFGADYTAKDELENIGLNVELNGLSRNELGDEKNGGHYHQSMGMHSGGGTYEGGMHSGSHSEGSEGMHGDAQNNPMNNSGYTSLSAKTSFKQKFVLNTGSE